VQVPHTLAPKAEVDVTLSRKGRGLRLEVHQANAVLRITQD
jgi:hypothetical protein